MTDTHTTRLIYLVYGHPGAGKTTVAERLARSIPHSILLSNDRIREQFRCPHTGSVYTQQVYSYVAHEALKHIDEQRTVIMDATFYSNRYRLTIFEYLRACTPLYVLLHIVTPVNICRRRVSLRSHTTDLQGMNDVNSFERCIAATEAWRDDEIPNQWYRLEIDCSDEQPRILDDCSQIVPVDIVQQISVALGGEPDGI